jgi:hypothetical protein
MCVITSFCASKEYKEDRVYSIAQNNKNNPLWINKLILFTYFLTNKIFKARFFCEHNVLQKILPWCQQSCGSGSSKSFSGEWASMGDRLEDQEQGRMVLRNMNLNDFTVPFSRLASTDRFPLSSFPKAWNSLDSVEIKSIRCKSDFNAKLKDHLLGQLDPNYKCSRLLCPHCHFNNWSQFSPVVFMLIFLC